MDICMCASKECEKFDSCLRGDGYSYNLGDFLTYSYFSEICNEGNNYPEFIPADATVKRKNI